MTAASTQVFAIPELLENILLSLPATPNHEELSSIRTILSSQRVCRTWLAVIKSSKFICEFCYLPWSPPSSPATSTSTLTSEPRYPTPIQTPTLILYLRPNPYISRTLLSHGIETGRAREETKDPWLINCDTIASRYGLPSTTTANNNSRSTQTWTFSLPISREQFVRSLQQKRQRDQYFQENWREMFVTSPPFSEAWLTRCWCKPGVISTLFEENGFSEDDDGYGVKFGGLDV